MTKKEKEEMERKQKKRNKNKNIAILILVVLLIAFIAFFLFKEGIIKFGEKNTTATDPSNSVSDNIDDYQNNSNNTDNKNKNNNSTDDEDKTSENEPSSDNDTSEEPENKNDGSVYSASLPLTDNDALAILNSRYGKGYTINRSTQNGEYTNFAVFKDDERYATVSVNLSTGDAKEMIIDTGKETKFNLLKGA